MDSNDKGFGTNDEPMRKKRYMAATEQEKLFRMAKKFLKTLGVKETPSLLYQYVLDTPVGPLGISYSSGLMGTIFTRFEKPAQARKRVACNPHSGKWNFHFGTGYKGASAFAEFKKSIEDLLVVEAVEKVNIRTISIPANTNGRVFALHASVGEYVHKDDIVNLLREIGTTEETDVRNRLESLVTNILAAKSKHE